MYVHTHTQVGFAKKEQLFATTLVSVEIYTFRLILTPTELLPSSL